MAENFYGATDKGRQRENNEDTFIAEGNKKGRIIGAAIDGVGGYSGGEIAASIARNTLLANFKKFENNILTQLSNAIETANQKIVDERLKDKEHHKMACVLTVAIADIEKNIFYYAHVGDSRLYIFRDGSVVKITKDHSAVGFLEDSGRISEEEAMHHPKRNEINRALGFEVHEHDEIGFIEKGSSPFLPGDILLLCSDGLTDMISSAQISEILTTENSLKDKGTALINAANIAGGRDNITVVLIKNDKPHTKYEAIKPEKKEVIQPIIEDSPIEPEKKEPIAIAEPTSKKRFLLLPVLIVLIISILLYTVFRKENKIPTAVVPAVKYQTLQDSVNDTISDTVILSQSATVLKRHDSLIINKDTLHIIGNGTIFEADSLYKGAAIVLRPNCKYIIIDSVTFKNFDIGILVSQKGLILKSVQFENCVTPVKYQYLSDNSHQNIPRTDSNSLLNIQQKKKIH